MVCHHAEVPPDDGPYSLGPGIPKATTTAASFHASQNTHVPAMHAMPVTLFLLVLLVNNSVVRLPMQCWHQAQSSATGPWASRGGCLAAWAVVCSSARVNTKHHLLCFPCVVQLSLMKELGYTREAEEMVFTVVHCCNSPHAGTATTSQSVLHLRSGGRQGTYSRISCLSTTTTQHTATHSHGPAARGSPDRAYTNVSTRTAKQTTPPRLPSSAKLSR